VGAGQIEAVAGAAAEGNGGAEVVETVVNDERENIGRNDPCWCGSGKKFKKCHGA
jgi:preprotein translocase subunit SecA